MECASVWFTWSHMNVSLGALRCDGYEKCEPHCYWVLALSSSLHYKIIWRLPSVKKRTLPPASNRLLLFVCLISSLPIQSSAARRSVRTNNIRSFYSTLKSRCEVWWVLHCTRTHTHTHTCARCPRSTLKVYCLFARLYLMWMTNCHKQDIFMCI